MKKLLLAATALAALSTASLAADLPSSKGPPMAPVFAAPIFTWTGFYVGLQGGYQWGDTRWGTRTIPGGVAIDAASHNTNGWMFGGHVGVNYQFGQLVAGVEGDLEWTGARGGSIGGALTHFHNTKIDWQGSVRGRLGVAFDRALIYATGGVAFADVNHTWGTVAGPVVLGNYSEMKAGWTLGAGLEYALTNNITARAEYRYADYGRASGANVGNTIGSRAKVTTHALRAGVSYKF